MINKIIKGKYKINLKVTDFNRDMLTSLMTEAKKVKNGNKKKLIIILIKVKITIIDIPDIY